MAIVIRTAKMDKLIEKIEGELLDGVDEKARPVRTNELLGLYAARSTAIEINNRYSAG